MSETLLSVQGQLVGIPVEEYTGVSGIIVDPVNKTIRSDETVLYDGTGSTSMITSNTEVDLTEPVRNFERVKIYYQDTAGITIGMASVESLTIANSFCLNIPPYMSGNGVTLWCDSNAFVFYSDSPSKMTIAATGTRYNVLLTNMTVTTTASGISRVKVVGVNRIANK